MLWSRIVPVILVIAAPASAMAQGACGTVLSKSAITSLFASTTCVCGAPGATRPNLQWNETHSGGTISELGLATSGAGSAVGTYTIGGSNGSGGGTITYSYTSGGSYTWYIDGTPSGTTYAFCSAKGTPAFSVTVKSGTCSANC